ncbi:hypothetical protein CNQ36_26920 [Streptomyces fungicidicus]|uniref:Transposase DDE domain-containing protein n=1 Tax=Streptomyces fungicidicus TaxID=68203 RepID=A0A494UYQ8_9ACTN|nr:hypothetical protein CNQ36_26920 [Streptomyces fungicidicus]
MAWLAGCRRLHRRYERKAEHFLAFTSIAARLDARSSDASSDTQPARSSTWPDRFPAPPRYRGVGDTACASKLRESRGHDRPCLLKATLPGRWHEPDIAACHRPVSSSSHTKGRDGTGQKRSSWADSVAPSMRHSPVSPATLT